MLAHVAVDLEEGYIGQVGAGDLQHIRAVFGQDACNSRAGNDAAQL